MKTWVILIGVVVLALPQLLFYLYQRRFTFLPTYYPDRSLFEEHASVYGLHRLNVAQNVEIEGIVYEPDHTALTILYFGGKEQDSVSLIRQWSLEYPNVRWIAFNYRGYGLSQGRATEKHVLDDGIITFDWTVKHYGDVSLMGFSLGSSIASYIASRRSPKWVVLVAPFDSVPSLIQAKVPFIPRACIRYRFETIKFVREISSPVYVYNSIDDEIIPPGHVSNLRQQVRWLAGTKEFSGYKHDELLFSDPLKDELEKIFNGK
jgi:hypothetical protein